MRGNRFPVIAALVCGLALPAPPAHAGPECGPVTDGGGDNQAILLHDVQTGTDEDSDWISFVFDNSVKHGPRGGILYWQVPEFTVTPTGASRFVVAFRGATNTSTNPADRPYTGSRDIGMSYPILGRATQVKTDGDALVWAIGLKADRCPQVDIENIPPRVVLSFPH